MKEATSKGEVTSVLRHETSRVTPVSPDRFVVLHTHSLSPVWRDRSREASHTHLYIPLGQGVRHDERLDPATRVQLRLLPLACMLILVPLPLASPIYIYVYIQPTIYIYMHIYIHIYTLYIPTYIIHIYTHTHTHTHTLSLSLSLSLTHTHTQV